MNNIYTLTSLHTLIMKATHESLACPDPEALEAFCDIIRENTEGAQMAAQVLAARIHVPNGREALLALTMLDRCMSRCDSSFHSEIGKFRFLNEMIKLVSPKYFANRTAPEVRTRVLQLLHAWSIEFPKESKFKVAFEMLKNQGVVKETPPPLPPEDAPPFTHMRPKSAIFEDEEKSKLLQKLLRSKKPEDLQHANKLIKTMVREEERRSEASSRRAQEVSTALDSAGLLRELLQHAAQSSPDELQLIHELRDSCQRLRPVLHKLAASEVHAENLEDILHASDVLDEVFELYNTFVAKSNKNELLNGKANSNTLLDFAGAGAPDGHKADLKENLNNKNVIDELGDIFSSDSPVAAIAEPLKPVNLMISDDVNPLGGKITKLEAWQELDSLGEKLLKQSLPDSAKRPETFHNKSTKKIPMNAIEKVSPKSELLTETNSIFDLDFFTKKPETNLPQATKPSKEDDLMVDISTNLVTHSTEIKTRTKDSPVDSDIDLTLDNAKCYNQIENKGTNSDKRDCVKKVTDVKPLTDINLSLESVKPSKVRPLTAFEEENGVTVVLHFCQDKPRPDVIVIVISTTSKSPSPIEDYKFQAGVPKGCKVRLLTPSGTCLPAYNPFLPPPALTQLMLVARPAHAHNTHVPLKFVITYACDDEICTELGEVTDLPLDDV